MSEKMTQRVIYSCLTLPARLALRFELPMKDLVDLMQMSAFHETKRRGLKMREISELLDVSMRKVSQLSSRLRRNFAEEEAVEALPRRIEFMLWAEPLSEARLHQVTRGASKEEVDEAIAQLITQKRVRATQGDDGQLVYEVVRSEFRLVSPEWTARLDGLNNLVSNVANVIDARFFHDDQRAFARTLSLRVREQDLARMRDLYTTVIWETLREIDEAAKHDASAHEIDLSILWAPYDFILRGDDAQSPHDHDDEA